MKKFILSLAIVAGFSSAYAVTGVVPKTTTIKSDIYYTYCMCLDNGSCACGVGETVADAVLSVVLRLQ